MKTFKGLDWDRREIIDTINEKEFSGFRVNLREGNVLDIWYNVDRMYDWQEIWIYNKMKHAKGIFDDIRKTLILFDSQMLFAKWRIDTFYVGHQIELADFWNVIPMHYSRGYDFTYDYTKDQRAYELTARARQVNLPIVNKPVKDLQELIEINKYMLLEQIVQIGFSHLYAIEVKSLTIAGQKFYSMVLRGVPKQ